MGKFHKNGLDRLFPSYLSRFDRIWQENVEGGENHFFDFGLERRWSLVRHCPWFVTLCLSTESIPWNDRCVPKVFLAESFDLG